MRNVSLTETADEGESAFRTAVRKLVEDGGSDRTVTLLADARYPFHQSTGMVTNPRIIVETIEAVAESVEEPEIYLLSASTKEIDPVTSMQYLGYDKLDTTVNYTVTGVEDSALSDFELPSSLADVGDELVIINLPTVVGVEGRITTSAENFQSVFDVCERPNLGTIAATAGEVPHFLTIVDGTYTFTGRPHKSDFVLSGTDMERVDAALSVLYNDLHLDPYLSADIEALVPEDLKQQLKSLARELPNEQLRDQSPNDAMGFMYRTYARIIRDGIPPQFLK